jgi:hypothetical protein
MAKKKRMREGALGQRKEIHFPFLPAERIAMNRDFPDDHL